MTAFVTPPLWAYGDETTTVGMEKYRTNLTHFSELKPTGNLACPASMDSTPYTLCHCKQFLVYRTRTNNAACYLRALDWEGDLNNPDDDRSVSLPNSENEETLTFDLNQVPWLTPFMLYTVEDVDFCFEAD